VSERESQEWFKELTLLQTRGSELCHAIVGPPRAWHHLSEGMRIATLCHTEMAGELAVLWAVVTATTESVLGHSPSDTFHVEVVSELATEFQKVEDHRSRLERPAARVHDLLLRTPASRARLTDLLDEAVEQLRVELAARREADAELEALRASAAQVQNSVLGNVDGPSSLAVSLSMAVELFEGRIDSATTNRVRWGGVILH
jgi:hypothetical protein